MKIRILAAAAALVVSSTALAAVTLNSDGTGFVGKGDVQLAFGWNNAQLQGNADQVSFSLDVVDRYEAECEWTTGEGKKGQQTHYITRRVGVSVLKSIAYDTRANRQGQITGFNLTGYGDVTEAGKVPLLGGQCPGNGTNGQWISVELVGSEGGLYVDHPNHDPKLIFTP